MLCLVCTYQNPDPNSNNMVFTIPSEQVLKFNDAIVRAACSELYACENLEQIALLAVKYYGSYQKLQVN